MHDNSHSVIIEIIEITEKLIRREKNIPISENYYISELQVSSPPVLCEKLSLQVNVIQICQVVVYFMQMEFLNNVKKTIKKKRNILNVYLGQSGD